MTRSNGPWLIEKTIQRYKDAWLEVNEDTVIRPDGKPGSFATVRMKPGVSVLAMDDDGSVYLTIEYKYAIERESIEVVSGGIDEGESTIDAARRELREEVGLEAAEWTELDFVDPFTSAINSPAALFLARKISVVDATPEGTEVIKVLRLDLSEAVQMVLDGRITHGPSCVVLLKTSFLLNR
jgi:ADP-ribose pyrophosphatase